MGTLAFFQDTQPSDGIHYLVSINKAKKGSKSTPQIIHYPYPSVEAMAVGVEEHSTNTSVNLYHACGSYKHESVTVNGSKKYRVQENWLEAKALWVDLDCGQDKFDENKGYLDQRSACTAIGKFCQEAHFPIPTIITSGNGIHCYWTFTTSIPAMEWKELANKFKTLLAHHGVLADPTCTADFARILRPVGAYNNKGLPKLVRALKTGRALEVSALTGMIEDLLIKSNVKPEPVRSFAKSMNDDLIIPVTKIPAYGNEVANHCAP